MILILCKYPKRTYIYAHTMLLLPYYQYHLRLYLKTNPILLKEGSLKRMKVTNESQHSCNVIFRFELEYTNSLRTHED